VLLLNACWKAGVRRVVFAGSSSAYGNSPSLPKVETMTPNPLSPYAVSKLSGEQYCQVFAGLGYVETVTFRYFNVFGPMQDPTSHYAAVIPKFATVIMEGETVPLNGDGTQSRDFTFIDNVVQANTLGLTKEGVSGQVFNIGCGERYDLNYLIQALGEIIGKTPNVQNNPPRLGDVPHSLADIEKAKALLGYQPSVTFYEGVKRTVDWLRLPESLSLFQK
jgi:UDP-glucose 4-epimerase